ncbi:MAG: WbqC family protein [candidate division WOR-3 bacterium]
MIGSGNTWQTLTTYWFADKLRIKTKFLVSSRDLRITTEDKNERLFILCEKIGVDALYVGAAGANYMDPEVYAKRGITVIFQDYKHPVYTQLFGEFIPYLSTLDLLLNEGPRSLEILERAAQEDLHDVKFGHHRLFCRGLGGRRLDRLCRAQEGPPAVCGIVCGFRRVVLGHEDCVGVGFRAPCGRVGNRHRVAHLATLHR